MLNTLFILFAFTIFLPTSVLADGYPFSVETSEIQGDSIQLKLLNKQTIEIASTGILTFSAQQSELLMKFYPNAPKQIQVMSPCTNDNIGDSPPNPVYCVWTSPRTVGITLNKKTNKKEQYTFDTVIAKTLLRISPDGILYHEGSKISIVRAKELIVKPEKQEQGDGDLRYVMVTFPPPYKDNNQSKKNTKVQNLFQELKSFCEENKVSLYKSW